MSEPVKEKIYQIYQFLKAANQLQFRPVRQLSDQVRVVRLNEMPNHPTLQLFRPSQANEEVPERLLSVRRPLLTKCPEPPDLLAEWLLPYWDDPSKDAAVTESRNVVDEDDNTLTIRFDESSERVEALNSWTDQRENWRVPEKKAREAMAFFQAFYDIYSDLEKDREGLELLVADGHLVWKTNSANDGEIEISHPILLKRVELVFDPKIPEFAVIETDRLPELYTALFADLQDVSPVAVRNRNNDLQNGGYHPLGAEDTEAFLRATIQTISPSQGEFLTDGVRPSPVDEPKLYRNPALVVRKRVAGIATAVDSIVEDIEQREAFSPALASITGFQEEASNQIFETSDGVSDEINTSIIEDDEILLAKEANEEQKKIIKSLGRTGSVIVQGPPGTGKTHTIANLIGHLLAQGKSILVTAQTTKALRVLHDKIPVTLQPLAVSVLGRDQDARKQLELSINTIGERLTSASANELHHKAVAYDAERKKLISEIRHLMHRRREALENEYRPLEIGSQTVDPSKAARFVSDNRAVHNWIPSPVKLGVELSLNDDEINRIYTLGASFTVDEERDSSLQLPDISSLPSGRQFAEMVPEYEGLLTSNLSFAKDYWRDVNRSSQSLASLAIKLAAEFSNERLQHSWRPNAIMAGINGGTEKQVWLQLLSAIESTSEANAQYQLVLHHRPVVSPDLPLHQQVKVVHEICAHMEGGAKVGFLQLTTKSGWRQFVNTVKVASGAPTHVEHFKALRCLIDLRQKRHDLEPSWNSLIGESTGQYFEKLGNAPELGARGLMPEIRRCLDWHSTTWAPLANELKEEGFLLDEIMASLPRDVSNVSEYTLIEKFVANLLPKIIDSEIKRRRVAAIERFFSEIEKLACVSDEGLNGCSAKIVSAVRARDVESYNSAISYAQRLIDVRSAVIDRQELIRRLSHSAPGWADQIKIRIPPHDGPLPPGEIASAWKWRQLNDILKERDALNPQTIQADIDEKQERLRKLTEELIDVKAWANQLRRLEHNNSMRQALVGWRDTTKLLMSTRQPARRAALLSAARDLMRQSVSAVPVWIMPIAIVAESFDPRTTRFDVVIVDEASQADLNGFIPLYLAEQVIVVGDHEQVTPLGVGKEQATLDNLRDSLLNGIPNSHLYNNMVSIYDIARQSFGSAIRLLEHFRCVPEIISFSNRLSYEGKIKPLREAESSKLKPSCVSVRVSGVREQDINKAEARRIVDLIKAMVLHPAYSTSSIGIISMLGESQARHIQTLIHKEIPETEIERRRIQAGIPHEFQGDERDIIFLSMVDSSSDEGVLRLTGVGAYELTKKRYNVASSRARDQLWMVHSFDLIHLKSEDLRHQLLSHVRDPKASARHFEEQVQNAESIFEKEVLKRLIDAGYKVKTQWEVGYYRIDMVVEGGNKRLAVECDGDRYHPIDKLAADIERQSVLERLGWQFVRIRGTSFFRDPDKAMQPVFERLRELQIFPSNETENDREEDNTLIVELEALIADGLDEELDDLRNEETGESGSEISEEQSEVPQSSVTVTDFLGRNAGAYDLEDLIRSIAKERGFQRLGRKARRDIESEIKKLARLGKIQIDGDSVSMRVDTVDSA